MVFAVRDMSDGKKRSKSVNKALKKVQNRSEAFWSGKKQSGVGNSRSGAPFLLNLTKLIDFGFGVEISTITRIQEGSKVSQTAQKRTPSSEKASFAML